MSYGSAACFCFMCHYFAYHGLDTRSANNWPHYSWAFKTITKVSCITVQNIPNMISNFQHLPSKSESNPESQDFFPIVYFAVYFWHKAKPENQWSCIAHLRSSLSRVALGQKLFKNDEIWVNLDKNKRTDNGCIGLRKKNEHYLWYTSFTLTYIISKLQ